MRQTMTFRAAPSGSRISVRTLTDLPNEVLFAVAARTSVSDMLNLSSSCRQLYTLIDHNETELRTEIAKIRYPLQYALRLKQEGPDVSVQELHACDSTATVVRPTNSVIQKTHGPQNIDDIGGRGDTQQIFNAGFYLFQKMNWICRFLLKSEFAKRTFVRVFASDIGNVCLLQFTSSVVIDILRVEAGCHDPSMSDFLPDSKASLALQYLLISHSIPYIPFLCASRSSETSSQLLVEHLDKLKQLIDLMPPFITSFTHWAAHRGTHSSLLDRLTPVCKPSSYYFAYYLFNEYIAKLNEASSLDSLDILITRYKADNNAEEVKADLNDKLASTMNSLDFSYVGDDAELIASTIECLGIDWLAMLNRKVQQDQFGLWNGRQRSEDLLNRAVISLESAVAGAEQVDVIIQGMKDQLARNGSSVERFDDIIQSLLNQDD